MKKVLLGTVLVLGLMLSSCQVKTSNIGNAEKFSDGVEYFQDKDTKAVFAVIVIRKQGSMQQEGIGLAYIPKSDITPEIKAEIKNYKE
jgi:hypothetical protein